MCPRAAAQLWHAALPSSGGGVPRSPRHEPPKSSAAGPVGALCAIDHTQRTPSDYYTSGGSASQLLEESVPSPVMYPAGGRTLCGSVAVLRFSWALVPSQSLAVAGPRRPCSLHLGVGPPKSADGRWLRSALPAQTRRPCQRLVSSRCYCAWCSPGGGDRVGRSSRRLAHSLGLGLPPFRQAWPC